LGARSTTIDWGNDAAVVHRYRFGMGDGMGQGHVDNGKINPLGGQAPGTRLGSIKTTPRFICEWDARMNKSRVSEMTGFNC
jgi:hypothetical protein